MADDKITKVISSWDDVQHELLRDSWDSHLRRYRTRYAFRGVSNATFDLRTSLNRLGNSNHDIEQHLIRNFRKYAHAEFERTSNEWYWVALGQHHGLPTRLLDWTYSPYVALHFVTSDTSKYSADGAIWCIDYYKAHKRLPQSLKTILRNEGAFIFTVEMLAGFSSDLRAFDNKVRDTADNEFVLFIEPPSFDPRVINQFSLFSMMSSPQANLSEYILDSDFYKKIIIPSQLKLEIRDKLDQSNITERVLFPGLDGLSTWLARHYAPLGPQYGREPRDNEPEAGT